MRGNPEWRSSATIGMMALLAVSKEPHLSPASVRDYRGRRGQQQATPEEQPEARAAT